MRYQLGTVIKSSISQENLPLFKKKKSDTWQHGDCPGNDGQTEWEPSHLDRTQAFQVTTAPTAPYCTLQTN